MWLIVPGDLSHLITRIDLINLPNATLQLTSGPTPMSRSHYYLMFVFALIRWKKNRAKKNNNSSKWNIRVRKMHEVQ